MAITYLKKSPKTSSTDDTKTRERLLKIFLKILKKLKKKDVSNYQKNLINMKVK